MKKSNSVNFDDDLVANANNETVSSTNTNTNDKFSTEQFNNAGLNPTKIIKLRKFNVKTLKTLNVKSFSGWLSFSTRIFWRFYHHKIKLFFFLIVIILISVFFSIGFRQLLKHNSQDNHVTFFDAKTVGDKLVTANITPTFDNSMKSSYDDSKPAIIQTIIDEYQKATNHNSAAYFIFCAKNSDYLPYFFNIDQGEWKYFRWFNLGSWWEKHWHNLGPVEQLGKSFFDAKNNYKHIYDFNYDLNDKSVVNQNAIANINTITTSIGQNPSLKKKHQNNYDLSGWEFNGSQITRKVLNNQTLSTDESLVNSKWYNDLSAGPIIIKIVGSNDGDVQIHLCNDLLNIGQLTEL